MNALWIGTAVLAGFIVPQRNAPALPLGPPPQVMLAQVGADGRPFLRRYVTEMVPHPRPKGDVVYVHVTHEVRCLLEGPGVEVCDTDGRRIHLQELPKLLKTATAVLVFADSKKVDPFYLRMARPGTLVVVAPNLGAHVQVPGPVAP